MLQAYGAIKNDGTVDTGSGNFSVTKNGPGKYTIRLQGECSEDPTVVLTPIDTYLTASAIYVEGAGEEDGQPGYFVVHTGYTDKNTCEDLGYGFSFAAFWEA